MSFSHQVKTIVKGIKKGSVMTYKEVAEKTDAPKAYRAVGTLMAKNGDVSIPCHRVIRSDGVLGNYNRGGVERKKELLEREGVRVEISKTGYRVKCS